MSEEIHIPSPVYVLVVGFAFDEVENVLQAYAKRFSDFLTHFDGYAPTTMFDVDVISQPNLSRVRYVLL